MEMEIACQEKLGDPRFLCTAEISKETNPSTSKSILLRKNKSNYKLLLREEEKQGTAQQTQGRRGGGRASIKCIP